MLHNEYNATYTPLEDPKSMLHYVRYAIADRAIKYSKKNRMLGSIDFFLNFRGKVVAKRRRIKSGGGKKMFLFFDRLTI